MSNLIPEQRTDKNGHVVTRHVKSDNGQEASTKARIGGVAVSSSAAPVAAYEPETLDEMRGMVTEQDLEDGMQRVMNRVGSFGSRSWDKIMGDAIRSKGNIAKYEELQREYINGDEQLSEMVQSTAGKYANSRAHARALDAGIETEFDDEFEKMWDGKAKGFSKAQLLHEEANLESLKYGFENGTVSASSIVGGGYRNAKKVAAEWIESSIADNKEAIRTRGRSNSVNISNAEYRARDKSLDTGIDA